MKHLSYIDHFIKLKSAPKMLELDLFPNAKEISESMSAYYAVGNNLQSIGTEYKDPDINLVCVGDGARPRTATLFAMCTKWNCISVDPEMNIQKKYDIKRLEVIKNKVPDITIDCQNKKTILVHVHSHAKLKDSLKSLINFKDLTVVSIPCCVPQYIENIPHDVECRDTKSWSPHNLVKIWYNLKEKIS